MNEKLLAISKITGLITGMAASIVILWGVFKFVNTTNENNELVKEFTLKQDSLYGKLDAVEMQGYRLVRELTRIRSDILDLSQSLDKTQKSYTRYLMRDNTLTTQEFYEYMNGLTTEKIRWQDTIDFKIKIRKK